MPTILPSASHAHLGRIGVGGRAPGRFHRRSTASRLGRRTRRFVIVGGIITSSPSACRCSASLGLTQGWRSSRCRRGSMSAPPGPAQKKRVSNRRGDFALRGDPVADPRQLLDRRVESVLRAQRRQVDRRRRTPPVDARAPDGRRRSAGTCRRVGQQDAGLLEALADRGDTVCRSSSSPSAGSTWPPGNTYMPPANAAFGRAAQHEHLDAGFAVGGVADDHDVASRPVRGGAVAGDRLRRTVTSADRHHARCPRLVNPRA